MTPDQSYALLLLLADCRIQIVQDDQQIGLLNAQIEQLQARIKELEDNNA